MELKIINPRNSKSGKSINFQIKGKWYSIKIELLEYKNISIKDISNSTITLSPHQYNLVNSWTMINDFKIKKDDNFEIIDDDLPVWNDKYSDLNKIESTQEISISELGNFVGINPLSAKGYIFKDSYLEKRWKIKDSSLKIVKENQENSIIAATQNFISRGIKINSYFKNSSSFISILILEMMKNEDINSLIIPDAYKNNIESSIEEVDYFLGEFRKLAGFKKVKIPKTKIKISKLKEIKIVNKNNEVIFSTEEVTSKSNNSISFITKTSIKYLDFIKNKEIINNLLKIGLGNSKNKIRKFKDEQIKALNILMHKNGNMLGILKTGFGKSLIYQFSTLLQPRIFVNVFPIVALINDQSRSLQDEFNLSYTIDNENLKRIDIEKLHSDVLYSKRLFLVTPERIENNKIQQYFMGLGEYIGYMVFDEAHCISEWGHDFRPSYLMSKKLLENLSESFDIKVIALTATAAPHIQKDISKLLNINKENIVNIADSSGLERKEIRYDLKYLDNLKLDRWNRSEKFANIIDDHIFDNSNKYSQLIAFHMIAGSEKDLEIDKKSGYAKYEIKISAKSTYERLKRSNLTSLTLFTGKEKLFNDKKEKDFSKLSSSKHIIATKSFGMGINLKECDYVLLTEPPYSLEDLYQQSGRVGRMGQNSLVEILYHDNVLLDPQDQLSPYQYFLKIDNDRKHFQPKILILIIEALKRHRSKPFQINVDRFLRDATQKKLKSDFVSFLMWSIAHLITVFGVIDKYSIEYSGMKKKAITIIPSNKIDNIFANIENTLKKLRIESRTDSFDHMIEAFYDNYFARLQADKLTGINIFINKLLSDDTSGPDDSKLITSVLTEYYKTRVDGVDILVEKLMKKVSSEYSIKILLEDFSNIQAGLPIFDIMEGVSRYQIDIEYIMLASLLLNVIYDEKMLATSYDNIINHNYKNKEISKNIYELIKLNIVKIDENKISNLKISENIAKIRIIRELLNGK